MARTEVQPLLTGKINHPPFPNRKELKMDNMISRCAYGAWHYGEQLCEACRKGQKE